MGEETWELNMEGARDDMIRDAKKRICEQLSVASAAEWIVDMLEDEEVSTIADGTHPRLQ